MDSGSVKISIQTMRHTEKDELFVCPYDSVHRVSAQRFVRHILKCRKNFPLVEKAVCPFNARHVIPRPELRHHLSCCPDARMIESEINYERYGYEDDELKGDMSVPPYTTDSLDFGDSENWDLEIEDAQEHDTEPNKTFGATNHIKPTNRRREALKRMKEELRLKSEEAKAAEFFSRAPRRPMSFPVAVEQQMKFLPAAGQVGQDAESAASPRKPHLAANFQNRRPYDD